MSSTELNGMVAPGFEGVAEAFARSFDEGREVAASCVVYSDGAPVVDLWAGATARGPWQPDMRTIVFSASKAIATICLLMAAERGCVDLDAPVATYWEEFAANGKSLITVRELVSHRAGLSAPAVDLTLADVQAWDPVVRALGAQAPAWPPGTAHFYHPITFGFLLGEVLFRTTGRRLNRWLQEEVAEPLGITMSFGVDPAADDFMPLLDPVPTADGPTSSEEVAALLANPLIARNMSLGGAFDATDPIGTFQRPEALACEIAGVNLIASARGLARVYAASIGEVDGVRLLGDEVVRDAMRVQSEGTTFLGFDDGVRWGSGLMIESESFPMGGPGSFGGAGLGGFLAFAVPSAGISFAFQTALPSAGYDGRAEALCAPLRAAL